MLLQYPVDLCGLAGAETLMGIQTPCAFQQSLSAQHLMATGNATVKIIGHIKKRRIAIGYPAVERQQIGVDRWLGSCLPAAPE